MKQLSKFFDYKTKEQEIAEKWKKECFYNFENNNIFAIDTPPPTVSGLLHMGHVFSYVQADIIARYKRISGFNVFYPIGFDDNGLPTERLVEKLTEKKVGKNCTKEEFIEICNKVVNEAEKDFEALFTQIGLSVDFNLKYQTISKKTAKISQNSFKELYNKGLIYKKLAPVYWDVIDKTALAQADIEEKEQEGLQIEYKALVEFEKEQFLVVNIMTTRAEMLPACVAVLFNPEDERYKKFEGKSVLLPTSLENGKLHYKLKVLLIADKEVAMEKGTGLVMCCAFGDMQDKIWIERHNLLKNLKEENLITDFGTLNHSLFTKEDGKQMKVEEGRKFIIQKLLEEGLIVGSTKGQLFEEALQNEEIKLKTITHAVKCGERSGKPVEILLKNQWYLSVMPFKRDLKELIKKINFYPEHMKIRLEQWIEGLNQDWCISRDRFFGISIPVQRFEYKENVSRETLNLIKKDFINETFKSFIEKNKGKFANEAVFEIESEVLAKIMESEEYLNFEDTFTQNGMDLEIKNVGFSKYEVLLNRNLAGLFNEILEEVDKEYTEEFLLNEEEVVAVNNKILSFKNQIEEIGIEGLKIIEEPLVLDTWFTSASSPTVAWGKAEDLPVFDIRPQAHEIIRTWAFYTIVKSYLHSLELKNLEKVPNAKEGFNSREFFRLKENANIIPWKNVVLSGWCLASDKTKMSKSKGNVVTPANLIKENGVDSIRLWCASASLGADTAYSEEALEQGKKFTNKLWNVAKFFFLKSEETKKDAEITEEFDKWILHRLQETAEKYKFYFEKFEYSKAKETLDEFFWKDLCDNYLEIIKIRYYGLEALIYKENPAQNPEEIIKKQQSCLKALDIIFNAILILYSPFAVFITEELMQIYKQTSPHVKGSLNNLSFNAKPFNEEVLQALKVIEEVRKYKSEHSMAMNAVIEMFPVKHNFNKTIEDLKNVTGVKNFNVV